MPSCCSPRRAASWSATRSPKRCWPTSPRCWRAGSGKTAGAIAEEFNADWTPFANYRGQNSNMHLTEALMAAFEATGDRRLSRQGRAHRDLIIRRHAGANGFRVAEHFDEEWNLDKDYRAVNEMFRPAGTTPGHSLEWARLILQLWVLGGKHHDWMPHAASELFRQSVELGWDREKGGFFYTLDWNDRPPCGTSSGGRPARRRAPRAS
jgi:sulfoquinovose isomerase